MKRAVVRHLERQRDNRYFMSFPYKGGWSITYTQLAKLTPNVYNCISGVGRALREAIKKIMQSEYFRALSHPFIEQ